MDASADGFAAVLAQVWEHTDYIKSKEEAGKRGKEEEWMDKGARTTVNEVKEKEGEGGIIEEKKGKDGGKRKFGNDTWKDRVGGFLAKVSQGTKPKRRSARLQSSRGATKTKENMEQAKERSNEERGHVDESERERSGHVDEPGGAETLRNERSNEERGHVDEPKRERIGHVDEAETPRNI